MRINGQEVFDASKLNKGIVPLVRLPTTVIERLYVAADQVARYALTILEVQEGDVVKENDTGKLYLVKDDDNLNNSNGYEEFIATIAASCPWAGITGTPTTIVGYGITDCYTDAQVDTALGLKLTIANLLTEILNVDGSESGIDSDKLDGQEGTYYLAWTNITGTPTTLAGYSITDAQELDATLTALAGYNTNGLLTQTAPDTFTGRTITGAADQIDVSNGNGVSGNPTLSLPSTVYLGTSGKIGRDADNLIDFSVDNQLTVRINETDRTLTETILGYVVAMNQNVATTSSPTFADGTLIQTDQNNTTLLTIRNDTSGTAGKAALRVNYNNAQYGDLIQFSPLYTGSGLYQPNSVGLFSTGNTNGLRLFTADAASLTLGTNNTGRLTIDSSGNITSNTNLTISTSAGSNPVFSMADADVAHGMTNIMGTNTIFKLTRWGSLNGGSYSISANDDGAVPACGIMSILGSDTPSASCAMIFNGSKKDGLTYQALSSTEVAFKWETGTIDGGTTLMTLNGAGNLTITGDKINISTTKTPSSAADTGTTGDICWDSSYIYVCVETDTWKRAEISTWS